jgi:zinc transporter 2
LQDGKLDENVNLRAAMIHMIGDIIQSVGVIIAGVIIYYWPEYTIADPICTYIFSVLVILTTVPIMKDCVKILMEQTPEQINTQEVYDRLSSLECV